jgi:hypothetical protein
MMTSCEWAAVITALATWIAQGKTQEEIAFLAALFVQLGDTLTTLSLAPPSKK